MGRYQHGDFVIDISKSGETRAAALDLRSDVFRGGAPDTDPYDDLCHHVVLRRASNGETLACFRMMLLEDGSRAGQSYSAQFYDLSKLGAIKGPCLEIGRFCAAPEKADPNIVRLTWTAITHMVQEEGVELLFGCSSFFAKSPEQISDALSFLNEGYLAPKTLSPGVKAAETIWLVELPKYENRGNALRQIPPLLKTYLKMNGWVSDHAVIDRDLGTIHVFTGVEIAKIPAARVEALKRDAG